jgi:hypothetical protein
MLLMCIIQIRSEVNSNPKYGWADNCILYHTIKTREDEEQLQADLSRMIEWSNTLLMSFNADKCHLLKITRHRTNIETSYHIEGKKL